MKKILNSFSKIFKKYYFCIFALLALLIPDFCLKALVSGIFDEPFVSNASLGFTLSWIFLIFFVCLFILPKRVGKITYCVISGAFIVLALSQYIYFGIFNQFFWIKSIALLGEGSEYLGYAFKYVDLRLLFCTVLSAAFLVIAALKWKKPDLKSKKIWLFALIPVFSIFLLNTYMQPELFNDSQDDWDSWRKPRVVYKQFSDSNKSLCACGFYQFTFRDIFKTVFSSGKYSDEDYERASNYFSSQKNPSQNEYSSLLEGKNLIAVMLEGVDTWMLDERYTPTICYMMKNGISFTQYYAPTFGTGHTLNSEFAFNTGFFNPITSVSAVNFCSNRFPYSLAHLFKAKGYTANSFHYNNSEFYNRGIMHNSFGFSAYNSFSDFGMPVTVSQADSNILKNDDIYKKMTEAQPFYDFVITYSGHVPYTYNDAKLSVAKQNHPSLIDPSMNEEKNNCLILAADTDDFFKQLLERLEKDGLSDNTVILAFTDHYAYGFSDQELLKEYKNGDIIYRVPAFIYSPSLKAEEISKPMMTVDFLPTLINLFGLENDGFYIGGDILDKSREGFVYFGNAAWLDEKMYYVPSDKEPEENLKEYIQKNNKRVKESFEINDITITGDYFAHH